MIDTSALVAILQNEDRSSDCIALLETEERLLISAGTLAEALIVAGQRNLGEQMTRLIERLMPEIIPVNASSSHRIANIYSCWGKGNHPARLNLGDCFAYDLAKEHNCPLLFVGDDFAKTDIKSAL